VSASDAFRAAESGARLKELRGKYPGADVWYVVKPGGHADWLLRLHADSPEHLEEALRDTAVNGGLVMPK
jgi:hypothetical protein